MRLPVEQAFKTYADRVFAAAFSVCRNRADADDVTQDVFVKYQTAGQDYADGDHLRAWLLRVAINRAKDLKASFGYRNTVPFEDYMEELEFPEPADGDVFRAVMELPDKYRVPIHLFYYEDYPVKEIASMLRLSEGTVKSQLNRGRKLLKSKLSEEWNDDE